MEKIVTEYQKTPIPIRCFDWSAVSENYEPGCRIGSGATEWDAVNDLLNQLEEDDE